MWPDDLGSVLFSMLLELEIKTSSSACTDSTLQSHSRVLFQMWMCWTLPETYMLLSGVLAQQFEEI